MGATPQLALLRWFSRVLILAVASYAIASAATGGGFHLAAGSVSSQVRDVLWFALLCGLSSFATLELAKRLTPVRGFFQRLLTRSWLAERAGETDTPPVQLFDMLLSAMCLRRRDELLVFNLPAEQLAAQVASASELAWASPREFALLLDALGSAENKDPGDAAGARPADDQHRFVATQQVRAGIDQLQAALTQGWRSLVQAAAVWVSGLYGI